MLQGLLPDEASTIASGVDRLFYFLTAVDIFFTLLIFLTVFYLAIRYRRAKQAKSTQVAANTGLEILWTVIPLGLCVIMFTWGAALYVRYFRPPAASLDIFVVGKQWMWKIQHPEGPMEMNELHVPLGRPIKLTMTSEDVIHGFFVPDFRIQKDVIPGRYTSLWFQPTKTGRFHFFCNQYCGLNHSMMGGYVIVMKPDEYAQWLSGGIRGESMVNAGAHLYEQLACITCHGTGKGPAFLELSGSHVKLSDGTTVTADEDYLRKSILYPSDQIVAGYKPIMPTYKGQITEEQVLQLIAYIKSLSSGQEKQPKSSADRASASHAAVLWRTRPRPGLRNALSCADGEGRAATAGSDASGEREEPPAREGASRRMNVWNKLPSGSKKGAGGDEGKAASMATATIQPETESPQVNYLNASYGIKSWLLTTDHKRIALLYLISITLMFFVGGSAAVLMRLNLISPQGAIMEPATYNKLFSMHGIVMVFFFLIPSIPAVLGNFLVPLMVGARDLAFPRLNLLSWYIFIVGALFTLYAIVTGGVDAGWTFYTPLSTTYANTNIIAAALGVFIAGFSSILTGLNFVVTIHKMRAPGLTWFRMPLFLWAIYATSIIQILGTPVLAISLTLVALERVFHVGVFDPAVGGDPVLFQHLFWFYSHPAVYIMILPSMGVISELVTAFSKKRIFGYAFVAFSSVAIAVISFLVWGHHMFVAGQSLYAGLVFSLLSFAVAIPSAIKVFNWTATLYKGSVSYDAPLLYALGFIGLFTMGGLTGLFLATLAVDVFVHNTYFVVAHFHYIMVGGAVMGYLGGIHYWWPKISGRMYPEGWAKLAAAILFVGFNLTFFPQYILGYMGMPRRYAIYAPEFQVLNVMSSAGASILGIGYLIPLVYLIWSLRYGPAAGPNPWGATGLEWQTPSPPPTENFEETPVVTEEAYAYGTEEETQVA